MMAKAYEYSEAPESANDTRAQAELAAALTQLQAAMTALEHSSQLASSLPEYRELEALHAQLSAQLTGPGYTTLPGANGPINLSAAISAAVTTAVSQAHASVAAETARRIIELTADDVAAMEQRHAEARAQFLQFETSMLTRMAAHAEENDVDITSFRTICRALQTEYEAAEAQGDQVGMAEALALRATNVRIGLQTVGASKEEIDGALEHEAAREREFLETVALEARRQGEELGLTGRALAEFVQTAVETKRDDLQDRKTDMAEVHQRAQDARPTISSVEEPAPSNPDELAVADALGDLDFAGLAFPVSDAPVAPSEPPHTPNKAISDVPALPNH